jgi:hypothetical protein
MKEGLRDGVEILHPSIILPIHFHPQYAGASECHNLPGF